jgi:sulfur carrier protein
MELTVNGTPRTIEAVTVAELMVELGFERNAPGVAAALNGAVVPKTEWSSAKLADGDTIDIIHAVQGG